MLENEIMKKLNTFPKYEAPERVWYRIEESISRPKAAVSPWQLLFPDYLLKVARPILIGGFALSLGIFLNAQLYKIQAQNYLENSLSMLHTPNYFYQKTFVASINY